jgi:hypothetical protein
LLKKETGGRQGQRTIKNFESEAENRENERKTTKKTHDGSEIIRAFFVGLGAVVGVKVKQTP